MILIKVYRTPIRFKDRHVPIVLRSIIALIIESSLQHPMDLDQHRTIEEIVARHVFGKYIRSIEINSRATMTIDGTGDKV